MKAKVVSSEVALKAAQEVIQHNKIIKTGDNFQVFEVPQTDNLKMLKAYALLLFDLTHDFAQGKAPKGTMIIPVTVDGRKGYFVGKTAAMKYPE